MNEQVDAFTVEVSCMAGIISR